MKIPFLNKSFSSSCYSVSDSSSWGWPSCHQNPRTQSFRVNTIAINPTDDFEDEEEEDAEEEEEDEEGNGDEEENGEEEDEEKEKPLSPIISFSSSSSISSTTDAIEELPETDSIENVIKGIQSSQRLIVEHKGESNSILELEEMRNKDSFSCPWNPSTLSLISSGSWWRWLRYTRFIAATSKCIVKTPE
ncbi:hypothetical protein CARUB_v10019499mg [Capsella rubella]|uniref:Uncharacterized protein n=1 Tax=Capsella rubella TaxID=81985 RepID=R0HLI2_9BRAS|nr:transcription repressor OFP18 [Capsella rubella]EOA26080.1 hypothetical protein CARUB_v10019499mg [Capsella rubella]